MENYKQTKRSENFVRLAVLFLVVLVCVAVFSFVKLGNARRENEKYENMISELRTENANINKSLNEMTSSDDYLEKIVRDEMGMIKDGETYIEFK